MTVSASEDFKNSSVSVSIPAAAIPVTTQVFGTEPTGVTVNGQAIQRAATLDEFQAAQTAYYYSSSEKLVYIKTLLKLRLRGSIRLPMKRNMRSRPM